MAYDYSAYAGEMLVKSHKAWSTGYVVHADFRAHAAVETWTLTLRMSAEITNIWGTQVIARDGDLVTLQSVSWTSGLAAGESAGWGFQAAGADDSYEVVAINGAAVGDAP